MRSSSPSNTFPRRSFLAAAGAMFAACSPAPPRPPAHSSDPLQELESRIGGRVGVFARTEDGRVLLAYRDNERFAMCSTFKWVLAAVILRKADAGELRLLDPVPYGSSDLLEYAPVARENLARGQMTVEELCEAAVTRSDNTAANLLLDRIGGPSGLTQALRAQGDQVTRLDRNEPSLNLNEPRDPRDTTSPRAMADTLRTWLTPDVLSAASRERLLRWMVACSTGSKRLRAGLPPGYRAGDKTGTGKNAAVNDVAIVWPEGGGVLFVAAYLSESTAPEPVLSAAHAEIGRMVADRWGLLTSRKPLTGDRRVPVP